MLTIFGNVWMIKRNKMKNEICDVDLSKCSVENERVRNGGIMTEPSPNSAEAVRLSFSLRIFVRKRERERETKRFAFAFSSRAEDRNETRDEK